MRTRFSLTRLRRDLEDYMHLTAEDDKGVKGWDTHQPIIDGAMPPMAAADRAIAG